MGPMALFDKSFIEMLNIDEATIFDVLFCTNICPIFYTEVLADLSLDTDANRPNEKVVADLARKTPILHAYPNIFHSSICLFELMGQSIDMRHVPLVGGGRPVRHHGEVGIIFEERPEAKAFGRWQRQQFFELERELASKWRALLSGADHRSIASLVTRTLQIETTPKTLPEALTIARHALERDGQRFLTLKTAYALLGLPPKEFRDISGLWKSSGRPPLSKYAPYTYHCLLIDVFFYVAAEKRLISPDRASNKIDMAYLYYLPFTMMFISNDKLHRRIASLFMDKQQKFVGGQELKDDLKLLDGYYSSMPQEERDQGLFRIAERPPNDSTYLTTRLWKEFGFKLSAPAPTKKNPVADEKILAKLRGIKAQRSQPSGRFSPEELADPQHLSFERLVPVHRGKWRLMPPGVEADA